MCLWFISLVTDMTLIKSRYSIKPQAGSYHQIAPRSLLLVTSSVKFLSMADDGKCWQNVVDVYLYYCLDVWV